MSQSHFLLPITKEPCLINSTDAAGLPTSAEVMRLSFPARSEQVQERLREQNGHHQLLRPCVSILLRCHPSCASGLLLNEVSMNGAGPGGEEGKGDATWS